MKTKLSFLLVLILVLSMYAFPAEAATVEYNSLAQSIEEYEITDTALSATVKITNNSSGKVNFNAFLAVYDASGIQKGVVSANMSLRATKSATFVQEIENYTYAYGDYVKAFLWDDDFAPISDAVKLDVFRGEEIEGVVISTSYSEDDVDDEIFAKLTITKAPDDSDFSSGDICSFIATNVDIKNLLGYSVTALVGENDNGEYEIFTVSEKPDSNILFTVDADNIVYFSSDCIEYYKTSSSKKTTISNIISYIEFPVDIDGDGITDYHESLSLNNTVVNGICDSSYFIIEDLCDMLNDDMLDEITLLDNNNDGDIDFVFATIPTYDSLEFVAHEVEVNENCYTITDGKYNVIDLDFSDDSREYIIIKDGVEVGPEKIAAGDTVTCLDCSLSRLTIYVSSVSVEGTVDEVDGDLYLICGTDYPLSPLSYDSDYPDFFAGDKGVFYINAFGKIAYADIETAYDRAEYVYLLESAVDYDDFDEAYLVKTVTEDGEETVYPIQTRNVNVYGGYSGDEEGLTDDEAYEYLRDYSGLLKITLSENGEITDIFFPYFSNDFWVFDRYQADNSGTYRADRVKYSTYSLSSVRLIFNVTYDESGNESVGVFTLDELFVHGNSYSFTGYGSSDSEIIEILVTYGAPIPEEEEPQPVGTGEYVYITDYGMPDAEYSGYIQAMTTDGDIQTFEFTNENVDVYLEYNSYRDISVEEAVSIIDGNWDPSFGIVKITLTQDGKISEVYISDCKNLQVFYDYYNDSYKGDFYYDKALNTYGQLSLSDDTVIFTFDKYATDWDSALSHSTVGDTFVDGKSYSIIACGLDDYTPDVLVVYDKASFDAEAPVMVVSNTSQVYVNNQATTKLTGIVAGKEQSLIVNPDESCEVFSGNVIMYSENGSYIEDIFILFDSTLDSGIDTAVISAAENITTEFTIGDNVDGVCINTFEITSDDEVTSKYFTVDGDIDNNVLYYASDCNITVVDYTTSTPTVRVGTTTDIRFSVKNNKTVFIKTVADSSDEVSDIVVFITSN